MLLVLLRLEKGSEGGSEGWSDKADIIRETVRGQCPGALSSRLLYRSFFSRPATQQLQPQILKMMSKLDEKSLDKAFEGRPDLQRAIRVAAGKMTLGVVASSTYSRLSFTIYYMKMES